MSKLMIEYVAVNRGGIEYFFADTETVGAEILDAIKSGDIWSEIELPQGWRLATDSEVDELAWSDGTNFPQPGEVAFARIDAYDEDDELVYSSRRWVTTD